MTSPFDHAHDLYLGVRVWNSLIAGMGRPIDMERKACESSIQEHDID